MLLPIYFRKKPWLLNGALLRLCSDLMLCRRRIRANWGTGTTLQLVTADWSSRKNVALDSNMEVELREASVSKDRKINSAEGKTQTIGWQSLLTFTILSLAWLVGFASRLFAVIRFESIIHEFDPW